MYDSCWKSPNHDAWRDALFEKVFLISWEWRSLLNEHAILKLLCTDKNLWLVYQSRIFILTFSIPGGLAKVPQINICTYIYTSPPLFLNKTLYKKVLLHEYSGIISSCLDINIIKSVGMIAGLFMKFSHIVEENFKIYLYTKLKP